ncbi:MAG: hypothetical protein ACI94Y_003453 [Maribacter sp.]|jgi:hypothetical protein
MEDNTQTGTSITIFSKILIILLLVCIGFTISAQNEVYPQEVKFSPRGGFFDESVKVILSHHDPKAKIYFTLDGSEPDKKSTLFIVPIHIKQTRVVRAIAYYDTDELSRMETSTYFVNEPHTNWPVVSMTIAPEILFDSIGGLFELGVNNELTGLANYGANFWDRKEYFMNLEIFEADSTCVYRSPCGFRLFGGMSRTFPQKSIAVVSRLRYGDKRFKHQFFEGTKLRKFKYLIFRNAGSDWNRGHGRDVIIDNIVDDWNMDKQAHRPCHAYINGEYWGIYYIREKINTYFIASHHRGVHPDTIDLVEHRWALKKGRKEDYTKMLQFIEAADMSLEKNYNSLNRLMNIENYTDYKLLEIFIDNVDAGGNIKFWKADTYDNGRWNWILYDTDWGFGLMRHDAYNNNSLAFHTESDGPTWPNPPWSTFILRELLTNQEFEHYFLNRFCDRLNTTFLSDTMLIRIEEQYNLMRPEMNRQFDRWNSTEKVWNIHYDRMINFAEKRPKIMWKHLMEKFDTGRKVLLNVSAGGRGRVMVNENIKASYNNPFSGYYFEKVPVRLHAEPRLGYKFSHWEGTDDTTPLITIDLKRRHTANYKAVFVPLSTVLMDSIIFNEVSIYNKRTGDWMELHNTTKYTIDVENWIVKNKKKEFRLPKFLLEPKGYMILAKDTSRFLQVFPSYANKVIGNFDFGLDREKDRLELYTRKGATVDTFSYNIATPGSDFTIDLKSPYLDNGDSINWEVKYGGGTPAMINPSYLSTLTRESKIRWVIVGLIGGAMLIFTIGYFAFSDK